MPVPILLDCDPGHDDAVAILLAAGNDAIDLRAITTVAGNCPLELATLNARRVAALAGLDGVPIAAGAAGPLRRRARHRARHPRRDRPRRPRAAPSEAPLDPRTALELMADDARGGADEPVTLVPDRPADQRRRSCSSARPDLHERIREIVLMGGSTGARQHHPGGRVQHLGRPRGGRDRVRERPAADDDRPQPHPPGARHARGARARARAARRARPRRRGLDGVLRRPLRARPRRVRAAGPRPVHGRAADRPDADALRRHVRGDRDRGPLDARRDRRRPPRPARPRPNARVALELDAPRFWDLVLGALERLG